MADHDDSRRRSSATARDSRSARLRAALRANLARRKTQARDLGAPGPEARPSTPESDSQ